MRFIDQTEIFVKAGAGGDGMVAFRREKYVPAGGLQGEMGVEVARLFSRLQPSSKPCWISNTNINLWLKMANGVAPKI